MRWLAVGLIVFQAGGAAGQADKKGENAGSVVVTKVSGSAVMLHGDRTTSLNHGTQVPVSGGVRTQKGASVTLTLSNGVGVQLAEDSELRITEFAQEPFTATGPDSRADEPSSSRTRLKFVEGEVVISVKKLNFAKGSMFVVETPAGMLGVRGTRFRVRTVVGAVRVTVEEGYVAFQAKDGNVTGIPAAQEVTFKTPD